MYLTRKITEKFIYLFIYLLIKKLHFLVQMTIGTRNYRRAIFHFAEMSHFLVANISDGHSIFFLKKKINISDGHTR